jgi:hypothetical protein
MISPPNPTEVLAITYEYIFYPPSSDRFRPPAQQRARGLLLGSSTPDNRGSSVIAQNSGYDQFRPAANGWDTIHPVSDMAPPLQDEEDGPPT